MPRITSFADTPEVAEEPGNEWKLYTIPGFLTQKYSVKRDDRSIDLTRRSHTERRISKAYTSLYLGFNTFKVSMRVNGAPLEFSIVARGTFYYEFEPEIGAVGLIGSKLVVVLEGVGRGVSKRAWRDSDINRNVTDLIHVSYDNPDDEEDLVWLIGSLTKYVYWGTY